MKEIRIHGRGGQGNVVAAEIMALAAFRDGKNSQAFPFFGSERMGAPVAAFVRISDGRIRTRSQIYNPDYVVVQDPTLIGAVDVAAGLKPGGLVVINTERPADQLGFPPDVKVKTVPASRIANEILGRPIPNTALVGAFAAATGEISLEAVIEAVRERFGGELAEKNVKAVEEAYKFVQGASQ
ncbi:MAG: pyruvate ferredoxin oxidoreductase subunit gamma [Armatimonadota bacterium]